MRRLTRKIGLFGGPGALMPAMGVKKPPPKAETPEEKPAPDRPSPEPARKSWFRRLFGSDPNDGK